MTPREPPGGFETILAPVLLGICGAGAAAGLGVLTVATVTGARLPPGDGFLAATVSGWPYLGAGWVPVLPWPLVWLAIGVYGGLIAWAGTVAARWLRPTPPGAKWASTRDLRAAGLVVTDKDLTYRPDHEAARQAAAAGPKDGSEQAQVVGEWPWRRRAVLGRHGGKLIAALPNESVIIFGPPASGKTAGTVIPIVLEHDGPAIVVSVTTEVVSTTAGTRQRRGPVYVYDPGAATNGEYATIGYDPVAMASDYARATRIGDALASLSDMTSTSEGDFWERAAGNLMGPLFYAAGISRGDITTVFGWLADPYGKAKPTVNVAGSIPGQVPTPPGEELPFQDAQDILASSYEPAADAALMALRGASLGTPALTMLSFTTTAQVALRAFTRPAGVASTRLGPCARVIRTPQDLDDLLDTGATIYLCGQEETQRELAPLFVTILEAVVARVRERADHGTRLPHPLLLMLDEAANAAPVKDLAGWASTLRSRDVSLVSVFQDFGQVEARWGNDRARSLFSSHPTRILLPGAADETLLELFSVLIGDTEVSRTSSSRGSSGTTTSQSQQRDRLASARELRELPHRTAVLIHRNTPPTRLEQRQFHREKRWRDLSGWLSTPG